MNERIIAFTGHRPPKIGGYKLPNPTYIQVCKELDKLLRELKPTKCISGMALGVDQWCAAICIRLGIPFIAAVPCDGQDSRWIPSAKTAYKRLLDKASEVVIVSPGPYTVAAMQVRNEWMCDHATDVIAVWDGSRGGTGNCVAYAKEVKKPIHRIVPIVNQTNNKEKQQ